MNNEYNVKEKVILIDFLMNDLNYNHKKAKTLLTKKQVLVNGKIRSQYNYQLNKDDKIQIKNYNSSLIPKEIDIVYEDKNIIVVNKPHNLLTIATESEKEKTLYHVVSDYVKAKNKNARIFIVHRLDKETSGLILFAKNEEVKKIYQSKWNDIVKYRGYVAVVEGKLEKKEELVKANLKENKNLKMYVSNDGIEAITKYKVIKENDKYSLVDIELKTGRKNQIRATFEYLKHPIIGDSKYSSKDNSIKRLALHAYKLIIINPVTKKEMNFTLDIPKEFKNITK